MEIHLSRLPHRKIVVPGPRLLDQSTLQTVTLAGVNAAGIWIESETGANRIADRFRVKPAAPEGAQEQSATEFHRPR
jgi:hypothetical protein